MKMPLNIFDINNDFETLLNHLKRNRGFDFTGYKRSSLMRRVEKRMQMVGVEGFSNYTDFLEVHPEEFVHLFNMILINVTAFFRDPQAWDYLQETIVPGILAAKQPDEPIRLWSAGCASGEEAYSLAMTFAAAMDLDQFKERVKIYATDIDDEALNQARQASYTARDIAGVPPEMLEKFFEKSGTRYVFNKDLRRAVIFGRHDLIQDAPISRIDLLVCRNALMYFNGEVQARILARLHFALKDGGFLFLGKAEMLFTHSNLFAPNDLKRRVFTKVSRGGIRERLGVMAQAGAEHDEQQLLDSDLMRSAAFDSGPIAQVVVDANGAVSLANDRARSMFRINQRDLGRPLQDLELSYRPVELRSRIDQAYAERRAIVIKDVPWPQSTSATNYLEILVIPLFDASGAALGAGIAFTNVTHFKELEDEIQEAHRELETAYEELQSTNEELETTNEELQSTVEELETTNEELQSTNEELETMNEELQSTNEELETMNEELQSTNEELQTINDELRQRSSELSQVNALMSSILGSLRGAVIVVDRDLLVQIWNQKAEDMWGLRGEEVHGKHLLNLDIGLPVEELRQPIKACLLDHDGYCDTMVQARNRRGKAITCKVTCSSLVGDSHDILGAILFMEEVNKAEPSIVFSEGDAEPQLNR